jgi:hypothetical protein
MTHNANAPGAADPGRVEDVQLGGGHPDGSAEFVEGIRRRRSASWRCEPRPDGRQDPLDPDPAPWVARAVVAARERRRLELEREAWADALAHLRALGLDPVGVERRAAS